MRKAEPRVHTHFTDFLGKAKAMTRLTRTNNTHGALLKNVPSRGSSSKAASSGGFVAPPKLPDIDINAEPLESDDETGQEPTEWNKALNGLQHTLLSNGFTDNDDSLVTGLKHQNGLSRSSKLANGSIKGLSKSSKRNATAFSDTSAATSDDPFDQWDMNSAQKKRRKQTAYTTNIHAPPESTNPGSKKKVKGFKAPRSGKKLTPSPHKSFQEPKEFSLRPDSSSQPSQGEETFNDPRSLGRSPATSRRRSTRGSARAGIESTDSTPTSKCRTPRGKSFKVPGKLDLAGPVSSEPPSPGLSIVPSSPTYDYTQDPSSTYDLPAVCPICDAPVDQLLLEKYQDATGRINVKKQESFCKAHKKHTAAEEYAARGYPEIKWHVISLQFAQFDLDLDDILEGRKSSHFRDRLEAKIASGRNRNLHQTMTSNSNIEGLTPGYYGTKGARLMNEYITQHFSEKLRTLAGSDKLIGAAGVAGFIQAVLVPELATLLVEEDMDVGVERAREVLVESTEVGDLLNEEDEDNVNTSFSRDEVDTEA